MKAMRLLAVLLAAALAGIGFGCDRSTPASERRDPAKSPSAEGRGDLAGAGSADAALAAALGDPDAYARARKLAELLPTLGPEAIPAVKRKLDRSRAGLGGAEFELLVHFWASQDPSSAATWAFGLIAQRYRIPAIHTAVELWAEADPAAALAGVTAASVRADVPTAEAARLALLRGWFRSDRPGLEKYLQSLGSTAEREASLLVYAIALVQAEGSDALMRWAEAIPTDDESYKRSAYFQATSALAAFDPAAAQRWCDRHCEGPYAVGMRQVIVTTWLNSGRDGRSMVEWVSRAPETPSNDQTLVAAYGIWAKRDREAALDWMRQQQSAGPQPWVRKLYGPFARHLAATSPAEAIEWAGRVELDSEREALLIEIAHGWRRQDEAAAEAWLAGSPLSESAREMARKPDPSDGLPPASAH